MSEKPILFSGPMVRAILSGHKTQTRRIIKPQPDSSHDGEPYWNVGGYRAYQKRGITDPLRMGTFNPIRCPYGEILDRLWVREKWADVTGLGIETASGDTAAVVYAADEPWEAEAKSFGIVWKPSIHMPKDISRITLEIVNIRVERLRDISEEDARAEGVEGVMDFSLLWESIHDPGSWDANLWVWVIEFRRIWRLRLPG